MQRPFFIFCALGCKLGSLIMARHNKLRDGVSDLAGKYFTPSHVREDYLSFAGSVVKRPKANPARTKGTAIPETTLPLEATEHKGDLLIRDLWQND